MNHNQPDKKRPGVDRTGSSDRLRSNHGFGQAGNKNTNYSSEQNRLSVDRSVTQKPVDRTTSPDNQPAEKSTAVRPAATTRPSGVRRPGSDSGKKRNSKKRTVGAIIGRVALSVFLIGIIATCLVVSAFGIYVFGFVDDTIDFDLNDLKLNYTTTIYVKDSKAESGYSEYQKLYEENRVWIGIKDMPQILLDAYVSGEDQRFYQHGGVDWKRTTAAFANMFVDIYGTNQGGSTITQQLVKNLTGDKDQSPMRKIREIMRARKLESTYSKETIMECYLNVIYLYNNAYGVEAASLYYFDKHAKDLTIEECASLAAITKSPAEYDPISEEKNHLERRNWVLRKMKELGKISESEYDKAVKTGVNLKGQAELAKEKKGGNTTAKVKNINVNSYFTDTVIEQVIADLMEQKGYNYQYAQNTVYRGGLKIYATLDKSVQNTMDKVYKDDDNFSKVYGTKDVPQSAMTIMDYQGHIVGIVGGRGEKTVNRGLNRATQSKRQTGSSMKPLGAYAPALEKNQITYSTKIINEPFSTVIDGERTMWPKNYDGSTSGPVTVQNALERSLNTVPARIVDKMTPAKSFDFVTKRFGITSLVKSEKANGQTLSDQNISAMALGGSTYGITPIEMTAAYAAFGNNGKYWKPTTYTLITDQRDRTVLKQQEKPATALSEDTANVMNHLLRTPVTGSSGTARAAAFGNWQIIAKTGTTSDNKDRWFIGGTPYYIAACWFGCDTPRDMSSLSSGTNPALRLWKPIMTEIHKNKKAKTFPESDDVIYCRYCTYTGLVAKSGCPSTAYGYFKKSYLPACTTHGGKMVSATDKPNSDGGGYSGGTSSKAASSQKSTTSSKASSKPSSSKTESKKPSQSSSTSGGGSSKVTSSKPAASKPASSKPESN